MSRSPSVGAAMGARGAGGPTVATSSTHTFGDEFSKLSQVGHFG